MIVILEGKVERARVAPLGFAAEFVDAVLSWTADESTIRLPATPVQPIATADVARAAAGG